MRERKGSPQPETSTPDGLTKFKRKKCNEHDWIGRGQLTGGNEKT